MSKAKNLQAVAERSAGVVDTGVKAPSPVLSDRDGAVECASAVNRTLRALERLPRIAAAKPGASESERAAVARERKRVAYLRKGIFATGYAMLHTLRETASLDTDGGTTFNPDRIGCHVTRATGRAGWMTVSTLLDTMLDQGRDTIIGGVASA